ncbi:hypothetical protein PYCC9005_005848 [Savitreella phatthalungensis]
MSRVSVRSLCRVSPAQVRPARYASTLTETPTTRQLKPTTTLPVTAPTKVTRRTATSLEIYDRRPKVVVVGSGWAGFTFLKKIDARIFDVTVVSPRSYFVFTPLLAGTAVGTLEFRTALENVRALRKSKFHECKVEKIDFIGRTVTCAPVIEAEGESFEIDYDYLVLAPGCYSNTFNIPGVKEHAHFLKDVKDAREIRRRILKCFEQAALPTVSDEERKQLLCFCVVGGGPTGVEFMAELHDLVQEDMSKLYPSLVQHVSYHLYDVAEKILAAFDQKLAAYATQKFARADIQIHTRLSPKEVTADELRFEKEAPRKYGLLVWSTGLMPSTIVSSITEIAKDKRTGGLLTNEYLQCRVAEGYSVDRDTYALRRDNTDKDSQVDTTQTGAPDSLTKPLTDARIKDIFMDGAMPNCFAIGDAGVMENATLPATAQVAAQKGQYLARAFNGAALGRTRIGTFAFKDRGIMAYIGSSGAIVQAGPSAISGFAAYLVWKFAYASMTVSIRNKLLVPIYWTLNKLFGRDINRF